MNIFQRLRNAWNALFPPKQQAVVAQAAGPVAPVVSPISTITTSVPIILKTVADIASPVKSVTPPPAPSTNPEQIHFFDVSDFQPNINFVEAKAGGNRFCSIKASQGVSEVQRDYPRHVFAARAAGVPPAPYHFFEEHMSGSAQFLHHVTCAPKVSGDMIRMVDVEANGSKFSLSIAGQENLADFLTLALKENEQVFIYYGYYFLINLTVGRLISILQSKMPDGDPRCIPWPASYGSHPLIAKYWEPDVRPLAWQYTDKGNVPGVGRIDSDWLYASEERFQKLILK